MLEVVFSLTLVSVLANLVGLGMGLVLLSSLPNEVRAISTSRMLNMFTIWADKPAQILWIIVSLIILNACYLLLLAYNVQWLVTELRSSLDNFTVFVANTLMFRTTVYIIAGIASFWVQWYIFREQKQFTGSQG